MLYRHRSPPILAPEATLNAIAEAFAKLPAAVRGGVWMLVSCFCFSMMVGMVRFIDDDMNAFEITFWRNVFGLAFMLPWLFNGAGATLRTPQLGWHVIRAIATVLSMLAWFWSITLMPLAEATALSFATPLFATLGAALFLGERVRLRRWSATIIGFAGTLVILRPGVESITFPAVLALTSAALAAPSVLLARSLTRTDSPATIVLYMGLLTTPLSAIPLAFAWTSPPVEAIAWIMVMGAVSTVGHLAFVRAVQVAETSAVMPFDFSRLIFVSVFSYLMFNERPDIWTWIGGAIVFAAALYTVHRESQVEGSVRAASATLRQTGAAPALPPLPGSERDTSR